ncbi:HAD family hydrolase [Clostridium culturomicium]|uniref:HAD family hydrolase n=1 Tax=Clostridium culturomicium TaxID=1499683 RepID=UPI00058F8D9A|nr:HAD family hydrolase [Clostridium culturomicium]
MTKEKVDGIIFDLDGTLWDSTEIILKVWNDAANDFKEITTTVTVEDIQSAMGLLLLDIGKKFYPYLEEEEIKEIVKHCSKIENEYLSIHGAKLYDNLEETLKKLSKNHKLFIVSNCQDGYIEAFYKAHNLEKYFVDFENPGRTGMPKWENIKLIVERNNLKNPVYVGDTAGDRKAAKLAGVPFVFAKYGFGDVEDYDFVVDKLEDVAGLEFVELD